MLDIEIFIKGLKLTWIRRILRDNKSNKWISLFFDTNNLTLENLTKFGNHYLVKAAKKMTNNFWKEVIQNLAEFQNILNNHTNLKDILRKPIWENTEIKIGRKCIKYDNWVQKGILTIQDLLDEHGEVYTYETFCQKYNINTPFTFFYGLKTFILEKWPEIKDNCSQKELSPFRPLFIEHLCKDTRGSRALYDIFITKLYSKPKYENKWEGSLEFENGDDWKILNSNIFRSTKDTKLIWFQYRIVHRIIATNKYLYRIKLRNDPLCSFCNNDDETIEHLFYNCSYVSSLWENVKEWIKEKTDNEITLSLKDILFLKNARSENSLNIVIMLVKFYIFRKRFEDRILRITELKEILKNYYKTEKYIYVTKGKCDVFDRRWNAFHR